MKFPHRLASPRTKANDTREHKKKKTLNKIWIKRQRDMLRSFCIALMVPTKAIISIVWMETGKGLGDDRWMSHNLMPVDLIQLNFCIEYSDSLFAVWMRNAAATACSLCTRFTYFRSVNVPLLIRPAASVYRQFSHKQSENDGNALVADIWCGMLIENNKTFTSLIRSERVFWFWCIRICADRVDIWIFCYSQLSSLIEFYWNERVFRNATPKRFLMRYTQMLLFNRVVGQIIQSVHKWINSSNLWV